ncbi:hypothetical protein XarjCFBP7653_18820 [Xanthomonas arboricola]|nr:hypothetical protein XarjCFBP7653_18820 [Xanthomonas arboricola]
MGQILCMRPLLLSCRPDNPSLLSLLRLYRQLTRRCAKSSTTSVVARSKVIQRPHAAWLSSLIAAM